jgi:MFS family permease
VSHFILRNVKLRALLASSLASNIGDGVRVAAFALLAISITSDARLVALVATAGSVPALVLAIPIGVLIDRLDRSTVLIVVDLCRALLYVGLTVILVTDNLSILVLALFSAMIGTLEIAYDSGTFALVPTVTSDKTQLRKTNTAVRLVQEFGNGAVGPAIGAALYSVDKSLPLALSACLFFAASFILRSLRRGWTAPLSSDDGTADAANSARKSARTRVREMASDAIDGFRVASRTVQVAAIAVTFMAWNLFGWMPESILVVYVKESLDSPGYVYGLLLAITAIGAVIGGVVSLRLPQGLPDSAVLVGTLGVYGVTLLLPGVLPNVWVAAICFFIQGVPLIALSAVIGTIVQRAVPETHLGRVWTLISVSSSICASCGLALGGIFAEWLGPSVPFVVSGIAIILCSACLFPLRRKFDGTDLQSSAEASEGRGE